MPWDDNDNTEQQETTRDHMEKALLEAVTVIRDAIREASMTRNTFLFEEYVRFLDSLSGDLAKLSEVLLALEAEKKLPTGPRPLSALRVR